MSTAKAPGDKLVIYLPTGDGLVCVRVVADPQSWNVPLIILLFTMSLSMSGVHPNINIVIDTDSIGTSSRLSTQVGSSLLTLLVSVTVL